MKIPCQKDCPDRNATCHAECEKYLAFSREQEKRRIENQRKVDLDGYFVNISKRKKLWFDKTRRKNN